MSDTRKSLNNLISQKLEACNERLEKCGDNLNERGNCLGDYQLWFEGAAELAAAANLDLADTRSLLAAQLANETELLLVERKAALKEALGEE